LSIEAVPTAVLISVGHIEHIITTIAEMTKLLGRPSSLAIEAETTMVTIGSQASGLIGRMIWTIGLIAALNRFDMPATRPSGTATSEAMVKPMPTVFSEVRIWSTKVGGPE
jgi:hypothetical protein